MRKGGRNRNFGTIRSRFPGRPGSNVAVTDHTGALPVVETALPPPNYPLIWRWITIVAAICSLIQIVIGHDSANVVCVAAAFVGTVGNAVMVLRPANMLYRPLSSWIVLIFGIANLTMPLVAKTGELEPLTYNLQVPETTFTYSLLAQGALIAGHWLYGHSPLCSQIRSVISYKIYQPLRLFQKPTTRQLWIMGFVGFGVALILLALGSTGSANSGSFVTKLLVGFAPFLFAPFLIPFQFLFSAQATPRKGQNTRVLLYFGAVVVLSMAANTRSGLMAPLVTAGLCWLIGLFANRLPASYRRPRVMLGVLLGAVLITPLLTGFVIAMATARTQRGSASPLELIQLSLAAYGDKSAADAVNETVTDYETGWSENYVHNLVLSRFVNTKFHDNAFSEMRGLGDAEHSQFAQFAVSKVSSILPAPVLAFLGSEIDKQDTLSHSSGDYLFYLSSGTGLGGDRTGSLIGNGVFLFGDYFLPVLIFACIPLLLVTDAFALLRRRTASDRKSNGHGASARLVVVISPLMLMGIWTNLYVYPDFEAVTDWIAVLLRAYPQQIIIYWIVFAVTARIARIRTSDSRPRTVLRAPA